MNYTNFAVRLRILPIRTTLARRRPAVPAPEAKVKPRPEPRLGGEATV